MFRVYDILLNTDKTIDEVRRTSEIVESVDVYVASVPNRRIHSEKWPGFEILIEHSLFRLSMFTALLLDDSDFEPVVTYPEPENSGSIVYEALAFDCKYA